MLRFFPLFWLLAGLPVVADDKLALGGSAEVGIGYTDGLLVPELDTWLKAADQANFWSLDAYATLKATDKITFDGGVSHYRESYQDYQQYDISLQRYYADMQYQLSAGALGWQVQRAEFTLGDVSFLQQNSFGFSYSHLFSRQYFLYLNLLQSSKSFTTLSERDSKVRQAGAELFYLPASRWGMVSLSLLAGQEDTADNFYRNHTAAIGVNYRRYYSLLGLAGQLDSGVKLQHKNFPHYLLQNIQLQDIKRRDRFTELFSHLSVKLNPYLSSKLSVSYLDQTSTLDDFDYQEFSVKLSAKLTF